MVQSGDITATGEGSVRIVLRGKPHHVNVHFVRPPVWIPCNHHHHHPKLHHFIDHEDESHQTHENPSHFHHDRIYILVIEWEVDGVEDIHWTVTY